MGRTVPTAPPDRGSDLGKIKREICRIEKEISYRYKREVETVPPTINKALKAGTVPPKMDISEQ